MSGQNDSLNLHRRLKGKLELNSKIPLRSRRILARVYTPGVSQIVKAINKNHREAFNLTLKNNTVAVISDGSAILGHGKLGPLPALPVIEGKCLLFKRFAGLNAFPLCLDSFDTEEIVQTIKIISPAFAAMCLEDIAAPRCFEIEKKLQSLPIPVVHDDQHATGIVVLAALFNALKIVGKDIAQVKIIIVGAGAAGSACYKLLEFAGVRNLLIVDRVGIVSAKRKKLLQYKKDLLKNSALKNLSGDLKTACRDSDILIGLSAKNIFTKQMIKCMNPNPVVFALANPDPELTFEKAKKWGVKVYGSGASDRINQINNALVFPGMFKGLIANRKAILGLELKLKIARSLAALIKKPSPNRFIPSVFDKRVVPAIADAVRRFTL